MAELGERLKETAASLSFPRYPGTEGDRRAIELVDERLRRAGLDVRIQAFDYDLGPVWRLLRALLLSCAVALVGAGWLLPLHTASAAVLVALSLLAAISLLIWAPWMERLYGRPGTTGTANVEARRWGSNHGPRLIFMAHHDSKSQNITMLVRGALTVTALLSALTLLTLIVLLLGGATTGTGEIVPRAAGLLGGLALGVLATLKSGNLSPGGVDNAGSLAILLELASELPQRVEAPVELRFLSTGAEEDHMVGAMRWLDRNFPDGPDDRPTWVINLDGVGAPGRLVLLERYGAGRLFSRTLSRVAREAADDLGLRPRGVLMPPAMGIDAIPFSHRGFEVITLSSGSLDRATLSVHSKRDVPEHLSPTTLEQGYRLAVAMAQRLAEPPSTR